ncbi:MAG: hypothetical protein AB7I38_11115 [Dehalococcoidia bacterium]
MKPEVVYSRAGFRPVGKCDWCGEEERALCSVFLPEPVWICVRSCNARLQRGELGPQGFRGAPFTGDRPRKVAAS